MTWSWSAEILYRKEVEGGGGGVRGVRRGGQVSGWGGGGDAS